MYQDKQAAYGYGSAIGQQTAMAGNISQLQPAAYPHGPLESAMDSIASGMQEAFSALDRMAEALRLVLQPEMPEPIGNDAKSCVQPPASPAVHRLHGLRSELEVLTTRMNALRCRLDA